MVLNVIFEIYCIIEYFVSDEDEIDVGGFVYV